MILLVVDTQNGAFTHELYEYDKVKENIKLIINEARNNNIEVAYVRHDDGPGTNLSKGESNYEIFPEFMPLENEMIFDKNVNSAFHEMTGLVKYLRDKNIKDIITVGVSTDYCMDATIKSGFEHGFHMIVPAYANSTYDNPYFNRETAYKYYNEFMWPKRYAEVMSAEDAAEKMNKNK